MRALLRRFYQGLQAASALYVLAALALPAPAAPQLATGPDALPEPVADALAPTAPEPVAVTEPKAEALREPEREAPKEPSRPKAAIGVNIPEGHFDFEPVAAAVAGVTGKAEPGAFPFVPPEPEPAAARTGPPLIYRRGRFSGPLRVFRNPWSDPANLGFNNRGDAGRARAFAFDDRPEPAPRAFGNLDPASVTKSWKHDIEQYRSLKSRGHREEDLQQRLGDRYSSVRWAASLDELPPPTDSYAAALGRERKQSRR
ncbi:MAG: hypothetical protein P4L84_26530 [Isosphaeraceae bacterium]|nr:hypothetical protein [Isosphaeraceae bacterium]